MYLWAVLQTDLEKATADIVDARANANIESHLWVLRWIFNNVRFSSSHAHSFPHNVLYVVQIGSRKHGVGDGSSIDVTLMIITIEKERERRERDLKSCTYLSFVSGHKYVWEGGLMSKWLLHRHPPPPPPKKEDTVPSVNIHQARPAADYSVVSAASP